MVLRYILCEIIGWYSEALDYNKKHSSTQTSVIPAISLISLMVNSLPELKEAIKIAATAHVGDLPRTIISATALSPISDARFFKMKRQT